MKVFKHILLFMLIGIVSSCQDVIDLDVPDTVNNIAISGRVTDSTGTYVTVSTTAGYFDQGRTPKVENARVLLFEDGNMVSELQPDSLPGLYTSDFNGQVGRQYEIEVQIEQGNPVFRAGIWRSHPEVMKRVFPIDSLTIRLLNKNTSPQALTEGYYALLHFQEPSGKGDKYRLRRWKNDSLYTQTLFIFSDEGPPIDGQYVGRPGGFPAITVFGPFDENENDSISIEIASLSKDYFEFMNLVAQQVFQVGSTFDPPPQTIIGNIYNAGNPEEYGFGYFAASSINRKGVRFTR